MAEAPKIAIFSARLRAGGAERFAVLLAEGLVLQGWTVDLVVVQQGHGADVPPSVNLVDLGARRARNAITKLRRYARRARPDAIVAVAFEQDVSAALALLGMAKRPPLVLTVHTPVSWYLGLRRGLSRFVVGMLFKRLFRTADAVVAVSAGLRDELDSLAWSPEPTQLIYNPVLPTDVETLAEQEVPHPWLRHKAVPVIVAVGRLSAVKNYPLLLDAFARVRAERDARLIVIGDGECMDEIKALAASSVYADSIALAGAVSNPFPFMRAADLLVLSSDFEGFGNVLVEAMAVGTPVVSTDCPFGPREILENGKWGRLVPTGDAAALASAILEQIDAPRGYAVERAHEFSAGAKVKEYRELIEALIDQRPSKSQNRPSP